MKSILDPKLIKACFEKPELPAFNRAVEEYFAYPIEIIPLDENHN